MFFSEYMRDMSEDDRKRLVPAMKHLSKNFRAHASVVQLANSIVDIIVQAFPNSIDKLKPEVSDKVGPKPIFLTESDDLLFSFFGNSEKSECEFGAEQVILVRDDLTKKNVKSKCGDNALVLTVREAKGMEFNDCLIYNFFKSGDLGSKWRVLYNYFKNEENKPDFDLSKHNVLCCELKQLYVLFTRTKQQLVIFDEDCEGRKPLMDLFSSSDLVDIKDFDDDIKCIFKASDDSVDDWLSKGKELMARKLYSEASRYFKKGNDLPMGYECDALDLEQRAAKTQCKDQCMANDLYLQAADIYCTHLQNKEMAAICCKKAESWSKAGKLYMEIERSGEAAVCYEKGKQWSLAAESHSMDEKLDKVLDCCKMVKRFEKGLEYIEDFETRRLVTAAVKNEKSYLYARSGALCFIEKPDRMMLFVHKFPTTENKRVFLRRYEFSEHLIEVEKADKCYDRVAKLYETMFKHEDAAEYYLMAEMSEDHIECMLRSIRNKLYSKDFLFRHAEDGVRDSLSKLSNLAEDCDDYDGPLQWERKLIISCGGKYNVTKSGQLGEIIAGTKKPKGSIWHLWKFQFTALRCLLNFHRANDYSKFSDNYTLMEGCIGYMFGDVEKLACGEIEFSKDKETSLVREKVTVLVNFFELQLGDGGEVVGSRETAGLVELFVEHFSNPKLLTMTMGVQEFAKGASKFFVKIMLQFVRDMIAYVEAQRKEHVVATYSDILNTRLNGKEPVYSNVETRLDFNLKLLELYDHFMFPIEARNDTGRYDHKGARKRAQERFCCLEEVVDAVLPTVIRGGKMDQFVCIRGDKKWLRLVKEYMKDELFTKVEKWDYDAIAKYLLLSERCLSLKAVIQPMKDALNFYNNSLHHRDSRKDLIEAFSWEISQNSKEVPLHSPLFYSAFLGVNSIINDGQYGGISRLLWGTSASLKKNGHCYSPCSFVKLVEKYFSILLLYMMRFNYVVMPINLVKDVLCVQNSAYANAIQMYETIDYQIDDLHDPVNKRVGTAKSCLFNREGNGLIKFLLDVLCTLNESVFTKWLGDCNREMALESIKSTVTHLVMIILTFLANIKDYDRMNCLQILRQYRDKSKKEKTGFIYIPVFLGKCIDNLRNLREDNIWEEFGKFCRTHDSNELVCLHCDPARFNANSKKIHKLPVKCLYVGENGVIGIRELAAIGVTSKPVVNTTTIGFQKGFLNTKSNEQTNTNKETIGASKSVTDTIENLDFTPGNVSDDVISAPEVVVEVERCVRLPFMFKVWLHGVKRRVKEFGPLDYKQIRVEKEFKIAKLYRSEAAEYYQQNVTHLLFKIECWDKALSNYLVTNSLSLEIKDEVLDARESCRRLMKQWNPKAKKLSKLVKSGDVLDWVKTGYENLSKMIDSFSLKQVGGVSFAEL